MPMCLDIYSSTIRLEIKVPNIEHRINLEKVKDVCMLVLLQIVSDTKLHGGVVSTYKISCSDKELFNKP
jgi:hypothetical protein